MNTQSMEGMYLYLSLQFRLQGTREFSIFSGPKECMWGLALSMGSSPAVMYSPVGSDKFVVR